MILNNEDTLKMTEIVVRRKHSFQPCCRYRPMQRRYSHDRDV